MTHSSSVRPPRYRKLSDRETRHLQQTLPAARHVFVRPSLWTRLLGLARGLWNAMAERRRVLRDEETLSSMPDHLLRDIGLTRHETGHFVRSPDLPV